MNIARNEIRRKIRMKMGKIKKKMVKNMKEKEVGWDWENLVEEKHEGE